MSQRTLQSLRVRVKAVAGDVEQAAGRVWRLHTVHMLCAQYAC